MNAFTGTHLAMVRDVCFSYGEGNPVFDGVNLDVFGPGVTGLIGPNGAGKSTLIRLLLGVLSPQAGVCSLLGPARDRSRVSYSPENYGLFDNCETREMMRLAGLMAGMKWREAGLAGIAALEEAGMGGHAKSLCATLSKGNRQKIQLISRFIGNPVLVLLDEPWSGLDPVNQEQIAELVHRFSKNTAVFLTAHHLGMAERFCDRILALKDGVFAYDGEPRNIIDKILPFRDITVYYKEPCARLSREFCGAEVRWNESADVASACVSAGEAVAEFIATAATWGKIADVNVKAGTLHDAYVKIYGERKIDGEDA